MVRIIDLFAGIGGIRKGFESAGQELNTNIKCVFTSEIDKYAIQTYQANFPNSIIHGDITQISSNDIPNHNILCAGFPCQAFSHAGLKKGFEDARGTLFFDICRILNDKKPNVVFLENVRGLLHHDGGKTIEIIKNNLINLGYKGGGRLFKAKQFGVPQNRPRIYIVGFREKNTFEFPQPLNTSTKVGNILEKDWEKVKDYVISEKLWASHQARKIRNREQGKGFGFQLFDENSPYTATLSARYYKDGSEVLIKTNNSLQPRKLTPRECARLQGFPEDFIIPVSDTQAYKQFGNSVAVPVIKAIAINILTELKKKAERK